MQTRLKHVGRLTLLKLSGSSYEQGYQHGQALASRIPGGTFSYFQKFLGLTIQNSALPWLKTPLLHLLRSQVSRRLVKRVPTHTLELIRGVADGSRLNYDDLLGAYMMPDTFVALIGYWQKLMRANPVGQVALFSTPACGCTSVIAAKSATIDEKIYHARNFDYPAVGYWDRDPIVMMTTPNDGIPYMSIGTSGIPSGGVTGMNAAGISLVIHQHWVTEASECLENSIRFFHEPSKIADARLALAQTFDLSPRGGRAKALGIYRELAQNPAASTHVQKTAKLAEYLPFTKSRARRLAVDFVFGSTL